MALTESKMARWTIARARVAGAVRAPPATAVWVAKAIWFQSVTTSAWAVVDRSVAPRAIHRPSLPVAKFSRLRSTDSKGLLVFFLISLFVVFVAGFHIQAR